MELWIPYAYMTVFKKWKFDLKCNMIKSSKTGGLNVNHIFIVQNRFRNTVFFPLVLCWNYHKHKTICLSQYKEVKLKFHLSRLYQLLTKSKVIFSEQQRNLTHPCGMSISVRKLKLASGPQRHSAPNPDPVNHILCLFIVYV